MVTTGAAPPAVAGRLPAGGVILINGVLVLVLLLQLLASRAPLQEPLLQDLLA